MFQLAVAQAYEQFLERAPYLNPRVSPGENAVNAAAIARVLDDELRMAERKLQLVPAHREYAAVTPGKHGHGAGKVRAVGRDTHIVHHIDVGSYGKVTVHQQSSAEDCLEVGFARFDVAAAAVKEVAAHFALAYNLVQTRKSIRIPEESIVFVPFVDHPAPRGPAPNREIGIEQVVTVAFALLLGVETGYHAYALVVLITVEHFLAKSEERHRRHNVILKHNALISKRERPFVSNITRGIAAEILFLIEFLHLAIPIHAIGNPAAGFHTRQVAIVARAVLVKEKSCGARLAHLFKNLRKRIRTIEENEQDGNIHKSWRFHCFLSNFVFIYTAWILRFPTGGMVRQSPYTSVR